MKKITRRDFVKVVGLSGSGLLLAAYVPASITKALQDGKPTIFSPSVYLQIDSDGIVTVFVHRTEMGQGVQTSLPMLVAEELEVPIEQIKVVQANADSKYGSQSTGGSWSIRSTYEPFRIAGATARTMLITAAASKFGVDAAKCFAENGFVINSVNKKKIPYKDLVSDAAKLLVPKDIKLKDPKTYKIIGKRVPRKDTPDKLFGKAKYGIDIAIPGMFYAVIKRAPVFGATVKKFDDSSAMKINGVVQVLQVSKGVAVIANSTWSAIKGRDALTVDWELGKNQSVSSETIKKEMESHLQEKGFTIEEYGTKYSNSTNFQKVDAVYELPFIAHAPMEPVNAVADITSEKAELWVSSQNPQDAQNRVARLLQRKPSDVIIHVTLVGGAFGRKLRSDFAVEAAEISNVSGKKIKLLWTRDDDMKHGYFRPASLHSMQGIVADGKVQEFRHHIIAPSIRAQDQGVMPKSANEYDIAGSATGWKYKFPYNLVSGTVVNTPVPVSWLRAVYGTQNPFAIESFVDELAFALKKDPVDLRKELLVEDSRLKNVLMIAAEKSNWNKKLPKGKGRGISIYEGYGSFCALVAEVSVTNNNLKMDRFIAVVDCGIIVNPDTLEAQIEGSIIFALSAALKQKITIRNGSVDQSNYTDFPLLTIAETPKIEVHIINSYNNVGGVGELAIAPTAPALCNAIFSATGKRIRKLPIELS